MDNFDIQLLDRLFVEVVSAQIFGFASGMEVLRIVVQNSTMTTVVDPNRRLHLQLEAVLSTTISNLRRLSGGASRETWAFEATIDGKHQALILRRDPMAASRVGGMELEAQLFGAAAKAGVPVPQLVRHGSADSELLDTGFLIMEHIEGETIARKILRDEPYAHARSLLVEQMGVALADLHRINAKDVPLLTEMDPLQKYRELLSSLTYPSPTLELAYRWLLAHRPEPIDQVVVHGDFRLGNVIVDGRGLAAVLDWELAHSGDPAEDLGWLCVKAWRFGGIPPVAGIDSYERLLDAYHAAGGVHISIERLKWWELAGTFMWGAMCLMQVSAHMSGAIRSVELAAIGRRVSEQEHDLLDLLGAPPAASPTIQIEVPPTGISGTPSIEALLEAVSEFLARDVMESTSGRVQFHTRVANNVLATVRREIALGPELTRCHERCLRELGITESESGIEGETALAQAIRSGAFDSRLVEVAASLRPVVTTRLAIANPKHS